MRPKLALLLAPALGLAGCVVAGLPPPPSLARVVHLPAPARTPEHGKVSASVGIVSEGVNVPTDGGLIAFDGEGSVSLWVDPTYDLTITTTGWTGEVDGNYLLVTGPVRFGVLHGLGLAVAGSDGEDIAFGQATLGLDLQAPAGSGAVFVAGRFTYATAFVLSSDPSVGSVGIQPYGYAGLSVGWSGRAGGLEVGPELLVMRRMPLAPADTQSDWMAAITFTVSAPIRGGR